MRAARALAGYKSTARLEAALAQQGDRNGLKVTTLNHMEQGVREQLPQRDLQAIATACGLPPTWFHVDSIGEAVRVRLPEVARLPPLTGELDRRAGVDQRSLPSRRREATQAAGDEKTGTGG